MFANKVVIVTGASSGIGAVTAEHFAKEGAAVAIVGRNETRLNDVAQRCKKLGATVLAIKADVSKDDEAKTIVKKTIDRFGKLDVLVNNAGVLKFATVLESNLLEVYDLIINTNLRSIVLISNLAVPHLIKTKGNIINISSVAGIKILAPGMGAYCMSKAAMNHFTRASAIELAPHGVRVNSVSPGPVTTEISTNVDVPEILEDVSAQTLLKRSSDPEEIADLILFVASDKGRGITGSALLSDNGMNLKL